MVLSAVELQEKIEKLSTNMTRLNDIVNGDNATEVAVDSGTVPSIARFLSLVDQEIDDALSAYAENYAVKLNTVADGTSTVYTLSSAVSTSLLTYGYLGVHVFVGGVIQPKDGVVYTIINDGTQIQFAEVLPENTSIYVEGAFVFNGTISPGGGGGEVITSEFDYETEVAFEGATIPVGLGFVRTAGYYVAGDGGGHLKKRIATPSVVKPWHNQSADGAWWEIARGQEIFAEMFGARADYDQATGLGTNNQNAINNALEFTNAVGLRGGYYRISDTVVIPPHKRLYSNSAGYGNSVIDAGYFATNAHAVLIPRSLPRTHVIDPMITECQYSGGVLTNQNAGDLYTTSSDTRLNTYRIMDFTNKNASGAIQATQRALSIAVKASHGSSMERVSIRTTANSGAFELVSGDSNWGNAPDIGYFGQNAFFASISRCVIMGSFRDAAVLIMPTEVVGDDPDYYPQTDRFIADQCFIEGHCSFAVRGADEIRVSGVTTTTIKVKWFRSHRFASTGSVTIGSVAYTYTSLTHTGDELVFSGLSSNPVSNGVTVGNVLTRTQDRRSYGTGGVLVTNSFLRALSHPTMKLSTDSFYSDCFDFTGRIFELSGLGVRGIHFTSCYMHGREDILGWMLNVQDVHFNDGWWECKSRNTPAGSGLDSCRLIGLSTSELLARGITEAVPSCAQNIKFTGWTGTGSPVDRRPAWRQSGSGYGVFGSTVSDDTGYFQPGRGYDDAYSGPSSGVSSDAINVIRIARLRSDNHPLQILSEISTHRASMAKSAKWAFGFGQSLSDDPDYAFNLLFGQNTIYNAKNVSGTNFTGYRAENTAGNVGFYVNSGGFGSLHYNGSERLVYGSNVVRASQDNVMSCGSGSYRWSQLYAATSTIGTSDERLKDNIAPIEERLLDAWEDVEWVQFQFKEALAEKGETARMHFGLIAQRVENVFKQHNLDAFALGLLCFDSWEAEYEDVYEDVMIDVENINSETGEPVKEKIKQSLPTGQKKLVKEAGNVYGLRYEECFVLEAAYQRRRLDRLEALITKTGKTSKK